MSDGQRQPAKKPDRRRLHEQRKAAIGAEVGEIPPPEDWSRRLGCAQDLATFGVTYFPHSVGKNLLSEAHVRCCDRSEEAIRWGGRTVKAVFRGFAKTTWSEIEAIFALLNAYRRFVVIVANINDQADAMFDSIMMELEGNDLLCADFPEVCLPLRHLQGKPQKCKSQTHNGERTFIHMSGGKLILPTIDLPPGFYGEGRDFSELNPQRSRCSGSILRSSGFNPPRRGMKIKTPDGRNARPDFYIIDDFQTDQTAMNPKMVRKQIDSYLYKAIFGSSGHDSEMSASFNVTPIEPDDAVEEILNEEKHPTFTGERTPMVLSWSTAHETLWQEYRQILFSYVGQDKGKKEDAKREATQFYLDNRKAMDDGCVVTWPHIPTPPWTVSAIQHAYNKLFMNTPDAFEAEYQMNPAHKRPDGIEPLTIADLGVRVNGYRRRTIPSDATVVTMGVDVHDDVLYWCHVAWTQLCQGWIVDYGTFPDQRSRYFSKRSAKHTLSKMFPGKPAEQAVLLGLKALFAEIEEKRVDLVLCDAGYRPAEVKMAIRSAAQPKLFLPSKGEGILAGNKQIDEYDRRAGYHFGENWYTNKGMLHCDTNNLKTWLHKRWLAAQAGPGGLSFWGTAKTDHRLFCEHQLAENASLDENPRTGFTKIIWKNDNRRDNHWLDALVYAAVAAFKLGCSVHVGQPKPEKTRRQRLREMAKAKGRMRA